MSDTRTLMAENSAGGGDGIIAHLGAPASTRVHVARARFERYERLACLCATLHDNEETGAAEADGLNRGCNLLEEDTRLVAFFLRRNSSLTRLRCVVLAHGCAISTTQGEARPHRAVCATTGPVTGVLQRSRRRSRSTRR